MNTDEGPDEIAAETATAEVPRLVDQAVQRNRTNRRRWRLLFVLFAVESFLVGWNDIGARNNSHREVGIIQSQQQQLRIQGQFFCVVRALFEESPNLPAPARAALDSVPLQCPKS